MAGPQGFEPRISVPKTDVIPLHHGPILISYITKKKNYIVFDINTPMPSGIFLLY